MIGGHALTLCLERDQVGKVISLGRQKTGISHPKLQEIVVDNFLELDSCADQLTNLDACIFCLGVYTGQVPAPQFREITVEYTRALAQLLHDKNHQLVFCYLSGQGADRSGKSRMMFARDKGAAENLLFEFDADNTYSFRPGYIYPVTPRKEPNLVYAVSRALYKPVLSKIMPNSNIASDDLAAAMVDVALEGGKKPIYENIDIRNHVRTKYGSVG